MKIRGVLIGIIFLFLFGGFAQATTVIDNSSYWNRSSGIANFGEPSIATFGQTFTVPVVDTKLDSFTFYVHNYINPDFVDFEAYVMAWDGTKASGSILYQSTPLSTTGNNYDFGNDYKTFKIGNIGLDLTTGQQYVAFFSASNLFDTSTGQARLAYKADSWGTNGNVLGDTYSGGKTFYNDNGTDFSALTSNSWIGNDGDLVFVMEFSEGTNSVPEPATMLLLGFGLFGLAGISRKLKK